MGLYDFTGILTIFALLFAAAAFFVIAFVAFIFHAELKNNTSKQITRRNAYALMMPAIYFFLFNILGFVIYSGLNQNISHETKQSLDSLMFLGWLPVNLLVYLTIAAILQKRIKSNKI